MKPLSLPKKHGILRGRMTPNRFPPARKLLSILSASVALAAQLPAASPTGNSSRPTPQFEALPLTRTQQNHLLVRAFINDKPALLVVDTGSPGTVISLKRRKYFGINGIPSDSRFPARVQVNGAFNSLGIARTMRLGGLNIVDVPAVLANFNASRNGARQGEPEADGILGADVLFETKAVLDCQRQLLILNSRPQVPGRAPGLDFNGFQHIPIFVSEGYNLYVDSLINGSPARLLLDTGAFATLLHRPFVRQLHIATQETRLQSAALNLKEEGVGVARIKKLSLGLVNIMGNNVGVVDLGGVLHEGLQRNPPAVGLLGAEILRRNHAIIDFGSRTLYLRR